MKHSRRQVKLTAALLLLFVFISSSWGWSSIEVLSNDPNIEITKKPHYYTKDVMPSSAHKAFLQGDFVEIPQKSRSFGLESDFIWIGFEIKNGSDRDLFLNVKNRFLENIDVFVYKNGEFISKKSDLSDNHSRYGGNIFLLDKDPEPIIYIIRVASEKHLLSPVIIGSEGDIYSAYIPELILFSIFCGSVLALFFYNGFLYISTKESDFLLYSAYIFSFFILLAAFSGYVSLFFGVGFYVQDIVQHAIAPVFTALLVAFALSFLNIERLNQGLYTASIYLNILYFIILLSVSVLRFGGVGGSILGAFCEIFFMFPPLIYAMYLGVYAYLRGCKPALYYIVALSGFFVGVFIMGCILIGVCDYNMVNLYAMQTGFIWEMVVLSLALGSKIKILQKERDHAMVKVDEESRVLLARSKYISMGETVGNIAHQWKQPLNAVGSIQNSIKASLLLGKDMSREKLLHSVEASFEIIKHLADTIDMFYGFLINKKSAEGSFFVADEFEKVKKMLEYSFTNSRIELSFASDSDIKAMGDANEFAHIILNIILNAKDALECSDVLYPRISVVADSVGGYCVIKISDNGGGIKVEPIDTVFNLNFTTKESGSGLGLFMVKNIVESRFGGTIWVNNIDGGAEFGFRIPEASNKDAIYRMSKQNDTQAKSYRHIKELTQKVMELEKVKDSLERWSDVFEHAKWGIAIKNTDEGKFESVNEAFALMHGYTQDELIGRTASHLYSPKGGANIYEVRQKVHKFGYHSFESEHLRKDGSRFPVYIELMTVEGDAGEILYEIINIWDISEEKERERLLNLKRFALEQVGDAVFLIDEDSRFHYVNEGACKMLGYTKAELESMCVGDLDPVSSGGWWGMHWEDIKLHKTMITVAHHRKKDGSLLPIEVASNYFEYDGVGYSLAISRDITERLMLEEKKEDEWIRLFFERQLVGMAIASPQKGWLKVNKYVEDMLGYSSEELKNMTWAEVTHPDDLIRSVEDFDRMIAGEIDSYIVEKRYIRKDGSIVHMRLSIGCVRKEGGDYALALIEDITERVKQEETLRMFSRAFEFSLESFFIIDEELKFIRVNDAASKALGYSKEELTGGMGVFDVDPDFDMDMLDEHKRIFAEIGSNVFETRHRSKDGRIYPVEVRTSSFGCRDRSYILALSIDITERKEMERSIRALNAELEQRVLDRTAMLAKSEREFRTLVENTPDFLSRYDKEGRRVYINPALANYFGVSSDEVSGTDPKNTPFDGIPTRYADKIRYVLDEGVRTDIELSFERYGRKRWHMIVFIPEFDEYGEIGGVLAIGRDITSLREADMELMRLNKELEQKVEELKKAMKEISSPM